MADRVAATLTFTVGEADTAAAVGSGDLPVLGTPRLLAWSEAATCAALAGRLPAGATSVGTRVSLEHLAASPVGARVRVDAEAVHQDGRLYRFQVAAHAVSGDGPDDVDGPLLATLLATGEVTRVVVDAERFLDRLG